MFNISKLILALLIVSISQHALSQYRTSSRATLYSGPSSSAPVAHNNVLPNTSVTVLNKRAGYSLVKTDRNALGWIHNSQLSNQAPVKQRPAKKIVQAQTTAAAPAPTTAASVSNAITEKEAVVQSIEQSLSATQPAEQTAPTQDNIMTVPSSDPYDPPSHESRLARLTQENSQLREQLKTSKDFILQQNASTASSTLAKENTALNTQLDDLKLENRRLNERNVERSLMGTLIIFLLGAATGYLAPRMLSARNTQDDR